MRIPHIVREVCVHLRENISSGFTQMHTYFSNDGVAALPPIQIPVYSMHSISVQLNARECKTLITLETDTFAFYILFPYAQNHDVASVRGVTRALYSQDTNLGEIRLGQFLT